MYVCECVKMCVDQKFNIKYVDKSMKSVNCNKTQSIFLD